MKTTKKELEAALTKAVQHILNECEVHGSCEICPLDGNGCPFGDEFPATIVCRKYVVAHFIKLAKGRKK